MSASPRFWQKLGLGRQNKPSDQQDKSSLKSSHSTLSLHDAATKQSKRFSTLSLRHRTSSVSIRPQATPAPPIPANMNDYSQRRSRKLSVATISGDSYSYMKSNEKFSTDQAKVYTAEPTHFYRDNDISKKDRSAAKRLSSESMQNLQYQSKNTRTPQRGSHQEPARRTPSMDKIPRIKPSKSNQSLASVGSSGRLSSEYTPKSKLRPPAKVTRSNSNSSQKSSNDKSTVTKRKSLSKLPSLPSATDNELLSCPQRLTRSSSNGSGSAASSGTSTSTSEKRKRMAERKLKEVSAEQENAMEQLQEDLEREKLSVRTLQGQKEAIAKDLDYFCQLVDEVTEEKDQFKKKYEEEKMKNERLQKQLGHTDQREIIGSDMTSQLEFELQAAQQQATESHYNFYSNLQCKNDEISRLKSDLKKAQRQIQVLRNTMEQMLKADGKSFDDDCDTVQTRSSYEDSVTSESDSKHLLLQTGFPEQRHSPPSPTPGVNEDVSGYDFLNNDYGSKKKPESFNKKALVSRMRKDQLEEMLGEVDSQLYRVRQQIRRPS